jgi:hypothetical protein
MLAAGEVFCVVEKSAEATPRQQAPETLKWMEHNIYIGGSWEFLLNNPLDLGVVVLAHRNGEIRNL